jgi:hypothetical protein
MRKMYLSAEEVSAALGVSVGYAYKVIRSMNDELGKEGYMTIAGKVSAKYFEEKVYGFNEMIGGDEDAGIPRYKN